MCHLGIEHVRVGDPGAGVESAWTRLEEAEGQGFGARIALVGEERIGVDGERGAVLLLELE